MASTHLNITNYHTQIPGGFSDDQRTWTFPEIGSVNAHSRRTFWRISVRAFHRDDLAAAKSSTPESKIFLELIPRLFDNAQVNRDICGWIRVDSGVVGGKTREVVPTVVSAGKNIGKSSETTPFCQALRDALGVYNKYAQKHTPASVGDGVGEGELQLYPPMLAKKIEDVKVKISPENPGFLQSKYNGVRVMSAYDVNSSRVVMYSRTCIEYVGFLRIREELRDVLAAEWRAGNRIYIDGEAYEHGVSLQHISGEARRIHDTGEISLVKYMMYDCWLPDEPEAAFSKRLKVLSAVASKLPGVLTVLVPTVSVASMEEVTTRYEGYLREGYEGAILRLDKPYVVSKNQIRSSGLLKIKPIQDAEFELVGFSAGKKGKSANALMVTCTIVIDGTRRDFNVTPALEIAVREELLIKMQEVEKNGKTHFENQWLGVKITVFYAETSDSGIPQQARTKLERRAD